MFGANLRIGLAQISVRVGDLWGNARKILAVVQQARDLGVDVLTFPELIVTGYPPEDLLMRPRFVRDNMKVTRELARQIQGLVAVIGFVDRTAEGLRNAVAVVQRGIMSVVYHKIHLPNYGVFDEKRYFVPGSQAKVFVCNGVRFAISICEDIWVPDVTRIQAQEGGAQIILNASSSPYYAGKRTEREEMLANRARENHCHIAYVNLVGAQDELVFDGNSMVFDSDGNVIARAKQFEEDLLIADLELEKEQRRPQSVPPPPIDLKRSFKPEVPRPTLSYVNFCIPAKPSRPPITPRIEAQLGAEEEIYKALTLGLERYVRGNRFSKVVIGISGGIDSALTAALAYDALGPDGVIGLAMPSPFTSAESNEDAEELCRNLGIRLEVIPIEPLMAAFDASLAPFFGDMPRGVTEENLQARIRGSLLMAFSNKFNSMVVSTGNKSELATGYCTLYGDMVGGFAILKDVPKTLVFRLCRFRNSIHPTPFIPERIITKEPSAELKHNQKDTDSLPPYPLLDAIMHAYVVEDRGIDEIIGLGFSQDIVKRVVRMIDISEYKRRQGAPGIKITPKAFGKDRRMPICNGYEERQDAE